MSLESWLVKTHFAEQRLDRGFEACAWFFGKLGSKSFWLDTVAIGLILLLTSPIFLVVYVVGWIAEHRDNRRDGVTDVKK